ncbi:MAG: hypothetical protein WCC03_22080, partial [Candidatus Acidiferrales bacterium]
VELEPEAAGTCAEGTGTAATGAEPDAGMAVEPDDCVSTLAETRPEESASRRRRFKSARISAAN